MPSEGLRSQSITIFATALALAVALAVAGGCASGGGEGGSAAGSDAPYPNLGEVPDRPATMTEAERAQLEQGLVADNEQREYSEEVIEFQAKPVSPLAPPAETGAGDAAVPNLGSVTMPDIPLSPPPAPVAPPAPAVQAVSVPPAPTQAPPAASYTPVPAAPAVSSGDASTSDLNRAQLDSLGTPAAPPVSAPPPAGDRSPATVVVSSAGVAGADGGAPAPAPAAAPAGSVKVATILFGDGSSALGGPEREIVREVSELYRSSGRNVLVVGHASGQTEITDPAGGREAKLRISADRANAVAAELQKLGVPGNRITVTAAADDLPAYYETMPTGVAGNRRAEIFFE